MMWQGTFTIGIFWGMYIYRQRQLHTYSDPNLNSSSKKNCLDFEHCIFTQKGYKNRVLGSV